MFGFSRGAYTARSLAGLIGLCGILKGDLTKATEQAFKIYRMDPSEKRCKEAEEHGKNFSHTNDEGTLLNTVHFIGVWDTVGALGIPGLSRSIGRSRFGFHDTTLGSYIRHAYHALAINERRRPFAPTLWLDKNVSPGQKVEQVWFPGVHTNIGGGYVDSGLSDRAFLWMCLKARETGLGFKAEYMNLRVDPNYHGELRNSRRSLYKVSPPRTRVIGGNGVAGEAIHYSARDRFKHATETNYRQGSATYAPLGNSSRYKRTSASTSHRTLSQNTASTSRASWPPTGVGSIRRGRSTATRPPTETHARRETRSVVRLLITQSAAASFASASLVNGPLGWRVMNWR